MLDTLRLYQKGRNNSEFELNEKMFRRHSDEQNKPDILYKNFLNDEGKQSIYVMNNLKRDYVTIEFSVPKLLYGNSLQNVKQQDTERIEDILNKRLKGKFEADYMNMQISRLDVTQNMNVENEIPIYIHALNNAYSRDKRYRVEKYSDETLEIKNNSRKFTMYDKVKEAIDNKDITRREAKQYGNILRFEVKHNKARDIKTSFNKVYTLEEILKDSFFETAKTFQVNSFDKMFCNAGNYEMFMEDIAMIHVVKDYNKRNVLKNYVIKKMTDEQDYKHDFEHYEDLLKHIGMTRDGIRKSLKELNKIILLSKTKSSDIIEEIRSKLVA